MERVISPLVFLNRVVFFQNEVVFVDMRVVGGWAHTSVATLGEDLLRHSLRREDWRGLAASVGAACCVEEVGLIRVQLHDLRIFLDANWLFLLALDLLLLFELVLLHELFVCYECDFKVLLATLLAVSWDAELDSSSFVCSLRRNLLAMQLHVLPLFAMMDCLAGTWFLEYDHLGHFVGALDALVVSANDMLGLDVIVVVFDFVTDFVHHLLVLLMPCLLNRSRRDL